MTKPLTKIAKIYKRRNRFQPWEIRRGRGEPAGNNESSKKKKKKLLFYEWSTVSEATEVSNRMKIGRMSLDIEFRRTTDEVVSVV